MNDDKQKRMRESAIDFWDGVRPSLQTQMGARILPLEQLQETEVIRQFDQVGIDAFYVDKEGDIRGLASRVNYTDYSQTRPCFTFRYKKWDEKLQVWDPEREYRRKLQIIKNPAQGKFFPALHVESWSEKEGSGRIQWAYMAETKDLMRYIEAHVSEQNRKKVYTFKPKKGERREVVAVCVDAFAKDHSVTEVRVKSKNPFDS